jgi:dihydroorotase
MSKGYFIKNVTIINEGKRFVGCLKITSNIIDDVYEGEAKKAENLKHYTVIDGSGKWLIPGLIDDQVHFREPGLTHKGDLYTEPKAAVAGGITSYMEMPNTVPSAITQRLLADKYVIAAEKSLANYSFYIGTTNTNLEQLLRTDPKTVCGVKIFLGSSTGDMLVDDKQALNDIFKEVKMLIAVHCEDDPMIKLKAEVFRKQFGENIPVKYHAAIRDAEACYKSSSEAIERAAKYNTRLHILHISTAKEISLFRNDIPTIDKRITAEACVHHLWFSDEDYAHKGEWIKWNPSVKSIDDRNAIRQAVVDNYIDVLATDHAPHTLHEKKNSYFKCPSGGPLVQHALIALIEMSKQGIFPMELIVQKYAHSVADMFQIKKRGYLRKGYYADVVLVNPDAPQLVQNSNVYYKCEWTPFDGTKFSSTVEKTFVNGHLAYDNGIFDESKLGERLIFER